VVAASPPGLVQQPTRVIAAEPVSGRCRTAQHDTAQQAKTRSKGRSQEPAFTALVRTRHSHTAKTPLPSLKCLLLAGKHPKTQAAKPYIPCCLTNTPSPPGTALLSRCPATKPSNCPSA
jgi:hypothetical protein